MSLGHDRGAARALYSVFVHPFASRRIPVPRAHHRVYLQSIIDARRAFTTTLPRLRSHKWDEEITARRVYLVDPNTNKLFESSRSRLDIMNSLDRKTHRLVQVESDRPGSSEEENIPVCKILGKKQMSDTDRQKKAAEKERKKTTASAPKTIELNWAIDPNDLQHRLDKAAEFLEAGRKLEIVLAAKKKGRKATTQECQEVLDRIKGLTDDVKGAREVQAFEGKMGGVATMTLQGPTPQKASDAQAAQ